MARVVYVVAATALLAAGLFGCDYTVDEAYCGGGMHCAPDAGADGSSPAEDTGGDVGGALDDGIRADSDASDTGSPVTCTGCTKSACGGDTNACFNCLKNADPADFQVYATYEVNACGCSSAGGCYASCSTTSLCGGSDAPSACSNCLNALSGSHACWSTFRSNCATNSKCENFLLQAADCL